MKNATRTAHRSMSRVTSLGAAASITLLIVASAVALADKAPATRIGKTSLAGLDLSTAAGARAAYERIKTTAKTLCFQLSDSRKIDDQALYNACFIETVADAVRGINAPALAALVTSR